METDPPITPTAPAPDPDAFTLAYLGENEADCPACGYNVHALREPRCPECGKPLRITVFQAGTGISLPWVIATVAASLAAGIGLLVAVITLRDGFPHQWHFRVVLTYFLLCLPVPLPLLLLRRWFLRLGFFQWLFTIPLLLIDFIMLVWFMIAVIAA
jgi:hypothetical protein